MDASPTQRNVLAALALRALATLRVLFALRVRARSRRPRAALARPVLTLAALVLVFGVGPLVWPIDPRAQELANRLRGPSVGHPLGTDQFGRDVLTRVLYGGRLSLGASLLVTLLTAVVGIGVGGLTASRRGVVEAVLMRAVDVLLAFPFLLVALAIAGLSGGGIRGIVLTLGLFGWGTFARVSRGETLRVRSLPFVEAARALGASPLRVYLRHVLPGTAPALVVLALVRFAQALLSIAGLSFLGVGVQPPTAEWGAMLNEGQPFMERASHLLLAPGLAVFCSCLVVTLAAEALRTGLDPLRR